MKHTPGPWQTSRDAVPAGHVQITVYAESDGERVATAFREEANAHLISAAPDLLSALKALRDYCYNNVAYFGDPVNGGYSNALDRVVDAALAKAER